MEDQREGETRGVYAMEVDEDDDSSAIASSNRTPPPGLSLHDCIALGEIRAGLQSKTRNRTEEIRRLPYLLRILSSTRPLAAVRPFGSTKAALESSTTEDCDPLVDAVVDCLEDAAATHSVAGGIDVVANHLAPSVAKHLSRLPPLVQTTNGGWNTDELAAIARDPKAKRNRKKRKHGAIATVGTTGGTATTTSSDDNDDDDIAADNDNDDQAKHPSERRDSVSVAAEDSQESTVTKTVSELASLVVLSLDRSDQHEPEGEPEDDQQQQGTAASNSNSNPLQSNVLVLHTDDILSEKADGSTEGSDLSSTLVAILHNAPVLRSKHVAAALCRASVPQAGALISRMGANCPASISCLLEGCLEAYTIRHPPIAEACKTAVIALAGLSPTESGRVRNKLQSSGVMFDVQLKLGMLAAAATAASSKDENDRGGGGDDSCVPCLLLEHLSVPRGTVRSTDQAPGDCMVDGVDEDALLSFAKTHNDEPSLLLHFLETPALYAETLGFFSRTMTTTSTIGKSSKGKWCLFLKAFALLLLVPGSKSLDDNKNPYDACLESFNALVQSLCKETANQDEQRRNVSAMDSLVGLVSSCAFLLTSRRMASIHHDDDDDEKEESSRRLLQTVFQLLESTSDRSNTTRRSYASEVRNKNLWGIFQLLLQPPTPRIDEVYAMSSYQAARTGLFRFCETVQPILEDVTRDGRLDTAFGISSSLHTLKRGDDSTNEESPSSSSSSIVQQTKRLLSYLLKEAKEDEISPLVENAETAEFIIEATRFLVKPNSLEVPIVLPVHLDMAWSKIGGCDQEPYESNSCGSDKSIYILKFLYSLVFLDISPASPFAFDPRSAPMKEVFSMIQHLPSKSMQDYMLSEITALTRKHCAEFDPDQFEQPSGFSFPFDDMGGKSLLEALCNSIRAGLHENKTEFCKSTSEQLFLRAKARTRDSDVYCAVANAFLSSPHAPSPTYSYRLLCRDPIICLKFPLLVWKCRSLRRIALSVLENLLSSNNVIVMEESKNEDTASELLVARDAIIVRCLLAILHGGDSNSSIICSMTTSIIRWLIQDRSGLVAVLVKQGLRERDLDWLIENVPETMNDSPYLIQIFTERNCLTAAERLVAADAMIRIAIVHGQANELETGQMLLTAVSQLVDSFYLILGPVGLLPIDALFKSESSVPITQTSQKTAFRILKSLTRFRGGRSQIRRECSVVLQKFIGLCKGELQGTVAGRRKQLLKELYDAALKAER